MLELTAPSLLLILHRVDQVSHHAFATSRCRGLVQSCCSGGSFLSWLLNRLVRRRRRDSSSSKGLHAAGYERKLTLM